MTTLSTPIKHSWIPKGRGKGGEFSNSTPYDSDADTLIGAYEVVIESNAWVARPAQVTPAISNGGATQWLLPNVNSMALGNFYLGASALYASVYASTSAVSSVGTTGVYLIDPFQGPQNPPASLLPLNIRPTTNGNKWVFKLVKNRMYMANGQDRPTISATPVYVSTGIYPSGNVYPWGVTAPSTSMSYAITTGAITAGNIDVVITSAAIVGHGTSFTSATVGQTIFLLGVAYQLASITDNTHATLTGGPNGDGTYAGASGNVPNAGWQINTGNLSWDVGAGFLYSYAYYDPITGHLSNMAPLTQVNDGPPSNIGVSVVLSNIQQLLNATGTAPDPRFTQIVIYRSGHGGGVLFPLAVLSNSAASPPYSYTDTQNDDTALGLIGPGFFPGPTTTNAPPPNDLIFPSYWQGRFWAFSASQPGLLFFSARVDSTNSEIPAGVAEECFPLQNTVPIPDTDGVGTGLRVVGPNLYVETTRGIYTIYGSNPSSYGLSRVTSKGNGTSHFATCALPGEDANSADVLVHVGNDRRLYFLYGAGGDVSYSYPIQDQISDSVSQPSTHYMVDVLHNNQGTYLIFAPSGGVGSGETFQHAYDIERQVWFRWSMGTPNGITAMCEGILNNKTEFLVADTSGVWKLKSQPSPSEVTAAPLLITQRFAPPGVDRFETKQLAEVYLYDLDFNNTWVVTVQADGKAFHSLPLDISNTRRSILSEPTELYYPRSFEGTLQQGRTYTMSFQCTAPASSGINFKLAMIEAVWVKMSEDDGIPGPA